MQPAYPGRIQQNAGNTSTRELRGDDLIDHADLDGALDATRNHFMLGCELKLNLRAGILGHLGETAPVQDANGCNRAHDSNFGVRPGKYLGGTQ